MAFEERELTDAEKDAMTHQVQRVNWNSRPRRTLAGQVTLICEREGPQTRIVINVGGNPLIIRYYPAGRPEGFLNSRPPSNEEEREAAKAANKATLS